MLPGNARVFAGRSELGSRRGQTSPLGAGGSENLEKRRKEEGSTRSTRRVGWFGGGDVSKGDVLKGKVLIGKVRTHPNTPPPLGACGPGADLSACSKAFGTWPCWGVILSTGVFAVVLQVLHRFNCAGLSAPPRRKPGAQPLYINKKWIKNKKALNQLKSIKINTINQLKNQIIK